MKYLKRSAIVCLAIGGLAAGGQAFAAQGHIQFYEGPTGETFNFDPTAGAIDGDFLVFQTTGDTLGQTAVFFGDANVQGEFGTETASSTFQIDYFAGGTIVGGPFDGGCCAHEPLFDGVATTLQAVANTSYIGNLSSEFSFTTVPEPAAWALMLTGFGMMGATLRSRAKGLRAA